VADQTYVFDTSVIVHLFQNYYRNRFKTLWSLYDAGVDSGMIVSVREALSELIDEGQSDDTATWAKSHRRVFLDPVDEEGEVLNRIPLHPEGRNLVSKKSIKTGRPVADPYVISKAVVLPGTIVTNESFRIAARIPHVANLVGARCFNLEQFMEREDWEF
jgi:hypothetical protein